MIETILPVLSLVLTAAAPDASADWPRFRGPNGAGVAGPGRLPEACAPEKNLAWKVPVPPGRSSPIVSGGLLFLTGEEGDERVVLCLKASTGETVWRRSAAKARKEVMSRLNGASTPTPAADGDRVVAFFPDIGLLAFDRTGRELWRTPLGPFRSMHGLAASPVIVDGLVVLSFDQMGDSSIAAFRLETGAEVWRAPRASGLTGSYSTPVVRRPSCGPAEVVLAGALEATGYEAATGRRTWWATGLTISPVAVPLVDGDAVYLCEPMHEQVPFSMIAGLDKDKDGRVTPAEAGDPSWTLMIESVDRAAGNGDGAVDRAEWDRAFGKDAGNGGLTCLGLEAPGDRGGAVRWRYKKSLPYIPSPLLAGGALFVVNDGGVVETFDPATGRLVRQARLTGGTGKYYASPVAGDGKVFLVDEDGKVTVIAARPEWEEVSSGELGETCQATPAIAGGRIHLRGRKTLFTFSALERRV
jgi:outer membrane protein assembly factor BamB